jgi:hypothetical protein
MNKLKLKPKQSLRGVTVRPMKLDRAHRKPIIRTEAEAKAACIAAGQNPHAYIDYADLRNGKENWEYFIEDWGKGR